MAPLTRFRLTLIPLLLGGLALSAGAQEIDGELLFNQSFQGMFTDQTDVDLIQFDEVAGSLLTVTGQPVGNSGVKTRVELLDQTMTPLDTSAFESQKGKTFKIKKFPAPYTGTYFLRATTQNGKTGLYRVKLKGKPVADVVESGTISSVAELDDVTFAARANSEITGFIKRKSGDLEPLLVEVVGPIGAVSLTNKLKLNSDADKLKFTGVTVPVLGEYSLRLTGQSSTTGDYKVSFEIDPPKPVKGSVYEDGHPNIPGPDGPSIQLVDVFFGRGLRTANGLSMKVVNPLSLVATDPISGLPFQSTLEPLFDGDSLDTLIDFNLGPLYQPRIVPRNGVLLLRFDSKIDITSLKLVDGHLSDESPLSLTVNGQAIPIEAFVNGKDLILNPVTAGAVGFPASPLVVDGAGNPVASATGAGELSLVSKGPDVLKNTKGGGLKPRPDGIGTPDKGGIPLGFNPGNALLDFFNQSTAGGDIDFAGFLPDLRAPRLIREFKVASAFTPNLTTPQEGDSFTPTLFSVVLDTAFNENAKNGKGEWAGGVLRLRPGLTTEEERIIVTNTVTPLGGGLFRNDLTLASPIQTPLAIGQEYEIVRAEYFEPDPLVPIDPELFDPLNPENVNNTDVLNFVVIRDRDGNPQDVAQPVDPMSTLEFLFDEPMAPESFRPYESFFVTDDPASTNPGLAKLGRVTFDKGGKRATFRPEREIQFGALAGTGDNVGFGSQAQSLRFHIKVVPKQSTIEAIAGQSGLATFIAEGNRGITDAGGQPLAFHTNMLSPSSLSIDYDFSFSTYADPTVTDFGVVVHRFQGQAKTAFGPEGTTGVTYLDVPPEICGPNGNLYGPRIADLNLFANGFLSGAPVQFFQKIHDDLNPPPTGQLTAFPFGAATPLGGFAVRGGTRFIHLYRAVDASPDWEALAGTTLDLRNVAWAPSGGAVTNTTIPDLQVHAGHSSIIPDTKQGQGIPSLPQTGLCGTSNSNVMGGHYAVLGNPNSPYVDGAYDAVLAGSQQKLERELIYGTPKPGTLADNYNGKAYHIDNANLYVPQGTTRNYHPLPNGDFDTPFPYNNGAPDVKKFDSSTGYTSAPTWGGSTGERKPHSLLLEYRVRVNNEAIPAAQNGFTFAVGILSSALPRFRVFSYGVSCTSCCLSGGSASNSGCKNTCAFNFVPMDGTAGNGQPLEPDLVKNAAGPAPAPPGMACYCLQGPVVEAPAGCPDNNITNNGSPSLTDVAYGLANNSNTNNFGDNSRYFMVFNYVKRESQIDSPYVRAQPLTVTNPQYAAPVFDPPLDELPVGTTFDILFRASTNGVGSPGDTTTSLPPESMVSFNNPINQVPNTPFIQFTVTTTGDTSTQLAPAIEEVSIPFRKNN